MKKQQALLSIFFSMPTNKTLGSEYVLLPNNKTNSKVLMKRKVYFQKVLFEQMSNDLH